MHVFLVHGREQGGLLRWVHAYGLRAYHHISIFVVNIHLHSLHRTCAHEKFANVQ